MQCTRNVTDHIIWVGANDRRLNLFENLFPIPRGVSYNAYLIKEEKNTLMDTVDASASGQFIENVAYALNGESLDYLVVQHMEPDHCANIQRILELYPEAKVVGNAKTMQMIGQFFDVDLEDRKVVVKEGDTLELGSHTLHFVMAPMVHWPEVMVSYEDSEKILFSADAFGTFGALNGNLFNDDVDFEKDWIDDARRYFANIVGKYGMQVQALLKKAAGLDIQMICSLHGPVWRSNLHYFIEKHDKWSKYEPEEQAVAIIYGSIYGNTEQAADALAVKLGAKGVKNIAVYDASKTDVSEMIAEIFRVSHLVIACPTYNGGIYPPIENLLAHMKALAVQNRTVAVMDNGTWAATAGKQIVKQLEEMKNMTVLDQKLSIKSTLKADQEEILDAFAQQIIDAM